jgi:hypothetical protein
MFVRRPTAGLSGARPGSRVKMPDDAESLEVGAEGSWRPLANTPPAGSANGVRIQVSAATAAVVTPD